MPWTIHSHDGQRKYLTRSEVDRCIEIAKTKGEKLYAFFLIIANTGFRITESLSLSKDNINFEDYSITIRSLKKRNMNTYRTVPISEFLLNRISSWIEMGVLDPYRFWTWSRMTAYRRIKEVMHEAGIASDCASPKGLRHAFAVNAIQSGVPLNLVQRWLGHSDIKTTSIYTAVTGPEEREIARRMWHGPEERPEADQARPAPRGDGASSHPPPAIRQAAELLTGEQLQGGDAMPAAPTPTPVQAVLFLPHDTLLVICHLML